MKIVLDRKWRKTDYTIGRLYIDDEFFCNTLEDPDRGLDQNMDIKVIRNKKFQIKQQYLQEDMKLHCL